MRLVKLSEIKRDFYLVKYLYGGKNQVTINVIHFLLF